jgi:long-chain acyl-CoA synthetase
VLLLLLSAIPLSLYLYPHTSTFTFTYTLDSSFPSAAKMTQDLKKMMPQAKSYRSGPYTTESANATKVDGETIPRRNLASKDGLIMKPADTVSTLYDILRNSAAKFGNAKAVGARKIVNIHEETKKVKKMVDGKEQEVDKKWQYFELSPYTYKSFVEFEKMALAIGSGCKALGFGPQDRMHLFAATSMQWLASAHGEN